MTELLETTALGFLAGVLSALFGIGGGIPFVATLTLVVGLGQLEAQATSLAAMVPVAIAGAWQQSRYGNVAWRPAIALGLFSAAGVAGGHRSGDVPAGGNVATPVRRPAARRRRPAGVVGATSAAATRRKRPYLIYGPSQRRIGRPP